MKTITLFILMTLMAIPAVKAQTSINDSTTVRIGYSKGSRNTVAGAIDQLTEARMNKGLITSSLDYLDGRAAGVKVASSGNQDVMVSAVRVRGTTSLTGKNDPLVIIDGVTFRNGPVWFAWCCRCHRGGDKEGKEPEVPYLLRWQYRL